MLILALVVGAVTAYYLGIRNGVIAAGVSAAGVLIAMFVPGTALPVYAGIVLWVGGLYFWKTKLPSLGQPKQPQKQGWERELDRWKQRAAWLWKARK